MARKYAKARQICSLQNSLLYSIIQNVLFVFLDRDECREGVDNCSNTTRCVNYDGTFRCEPLPQRQCPNGSALHPVTKQCVTVRQCNAGYTFNIVNLVCEGNDTLVV